MVVLLLLCVCGGGGGGINLFCHLSRGRGGGRKKSDETRVIIGGEGAGRGLLKNTKLDVCI